MTHDLIEKLQKLELLDVVAPKYDDGNDDLWARLSAAIDDCAPPPVPKEPDECDLALSVDAVFQNRSVERIERLLDSLEGEGPPDARFVASFAIVAAGLQPNASRRLLDAFERAFRFDPMALEDDDALAERVFVVAMEKLHARLTKDAWKRHIATLKAYRFMVNTWTKNHKIKCAYPLIFPGIFLQLDDFEERNKIAGLTCCNSVLANVTRVGCEKSGYESVIYDSLVKYIRHFETSIVEGSLDGLRLLLPMMHADKSSVQWSSVDDVFEILLDGLLLESGKSKKRIYWMHLTHFIEEYPISAIRWKGKILDLVICSLEFPLSSPKLVYEDLTTELKCLESWLRVGWPVWTFGEDKSLIFNMVKIIYHRKECNDSQMEVRCLLLMLKMCNDNQKAQLFKDEGVKLYRFSKPFQKFWKSVMANC